MVQRLVCDNPNKLLESKLPDRITKVRLVYNRSFILLITLIIINISAHNVACVSMFTQQQNSSSSSVSIRDYATCDGITDDLANFKLAINDIKDNKHTLVIDCPLYLKIGMDITKSVFLNDGTSIVFRSGGLIKVDNIFVPAFVIANSSDIHLSNWNIQYIGKMPISNQTGGYYYQDKWTIATGSAPPANAFNNVVLTNWLKDNKGITFDRGYFSFWTGIIDPAAIFYIQGNSSKLSFNNFNLFVESSITADSFIPVAFSLLPGYINNTKVNRQSITRAVLNIPHELSFNNIRLDGFYMGWHGTLKQAIFTNISAYRYSTLQDSMGQNVGGVNKWFPPPHLFYLNYQNTWDSSLYNEQITLTNIKDYGIRIGKAEDKRTDSHIAGNACSLKIQANNSVVNNYLSKRPDGFLDICSSKNLKVSNVVASYNSEFLDYLFPIIRFPCIGSKYSGYQNILFENISLTDLAKQTSQSPITGNIDPRNKNIVFNNVNIKLKTWVGEDKPFTPLISKSVSYFSGINNKFNVYMDYDDSYNFISANDVSINKLDVNKYNNTIQNIPIGSYGLLSYVIKNKKASQVRITLPDRSLLPVDVSYDSRTTTCGLPNVLLQANQSCVVTLRYQPTTEKIKGIINFKVSLFTDKLGLANLPELTIPYSSR